MDDGNTVLFDGLAMGFGGVSLVFGKAVLGKNLVVHIQDSVTIDLGDDRCAGDRQRFPVASHDRLEFIWQMGPENISVDQKNGFLVKGIRSG